MDPDKDIRDMPAPTDKTGVQRLLGMVQYLSKFLPNLSDMTKPLRELTQQDVEWCWEDAQITALSQLKEAVTCTPVLRYYNLSDEVTLQCDASKICEKFAKNLIHTFTAGMWSQSKQITSPWRSLSAKHSTQHHNAFSECSFAFKDTT